MKRVAAAALVACAAGAFCLAQEAGAPASQPSAPGAQSTAQAEKDKAHAGDIRAAETAASDWLKLVDAGKYDESWKGVGSLARGQVGEEDWNNKVRETREAYGALKTRDVQHGDYATTLPAAPDGQYVVVRYGSSFVHKAFAVETVVMAEDGGRWKVAGYFLR